MNPSAKRRRVWQSAALKYAVPNIPGEWQVLNRELILLPFGHIARGVGANDYSVAAILEPLFMPLDYVGQGWSVAVGFDVSGSFPYHRLALHDSEAEKYMLDLARAVTEKILPFVKENGTLEGYFEWCRRTNMDHPNGAGDAHILFRQAATAVVMRRPDDAKQALDGVQQAINWDPSDDRDWVRELYRQAGELRDRVIADPAAAREELIAGMDEQKRRRKLPLSG